MNNALIAPCGINCGICLAYLRERNKCYGCRVNPAENLKTREKCKIKNCIFLQETISGFCFECKEYPCQRLKQLDKRYRTKYRENVIDNLNSIKVIGLNRFVEAEVERWKCKNCGSTICVHRDNCLKCGAPRNDK